VPKGVVNGEPRLRPWPGIVLQFTPSTRPIFAQVAGLMPWLTTPLPGKDRYVAATLPGRAKASNPRGAGGLMSWTASKAVGLWV
jgi:hypothetical protein